MPPNDTSGVAVKDIPASASITLGPTPARMSHLARGGHGSSSSSTNSAPRPYAVISNEPAMGSGGYA